MSICFWYTTVALQKLIRYGANRNKCSVALRYIIRCFRSARRKIVLLQSKVVLEVFIHKGDSLTFGTGVLMSSNFLRPPNNQTYFLKDPQITICSSEIFRPSKTNWENTVEISDSPVKCFLCACSALVNCK